MIDYEESVTSYMTMESWMMGSPVCVAAAFMALVVRVIKNAFAQAVKMKDELDYTV